MRYRALAATVGLALAAAFAGPVSAAAPDRSTEVIPDTYQQAECDGYDVWQINVVTLHLATYHDLSGNDVREVTHADTTGVTVRQYPDGSSVQVATYRDQGGIFVHRGDDFFWTGIIDRYETRDGTRYVNIGRQVFHVISWDPFEGEWASDVGISDDWDPCVW